MNSGGAAAAALLCDASARHRSPLATTELSTSLVRLSYVADRFMLPCTQERPPLAAEDSHGEIDRARTRAARGLGSCLRPREPAGDADRIVRVDAAAAAVLADPRINGGGGGDPGTPVPAAPLREGDVEAVVDAQASEHVAHGASEAAAGVEHRRGHAGELLLLRRLRERYERGEAAREVIGGGGHGRCMGSSGGEVWGVGSWPPPAGG